MQGIVENNRALLPDDFIPLLPEEITSERSSKLSTSEVHQQRKLLGLSPEE